MASAGDDLVLRYLELGLAAGRHVDGFVDAYYGPPDLRAAVEDEPLRDAESLAEDARRLAAALANGGAGLAPTRTRWLAAQLRGLETVAARLAGADVPYADEVERLYGVRPDRVPEERFAAAHERLDAVLPGTGSVSERYQAWLEGEPVPTERLEHLLVSLSEELRARAADAFGLPEGESVEFELVTGQPWSGYNYYLSGLRSRVAVNVDAPVPASFVTELVAHETYPGHHLEHAWKEARLVRERGWVEEAIFLIGTPQSLVSEGIAGIGAEVLLGEAEEDLAAEQLRRVGVRYDPDVARTVKRAREDLGAGPRNAALMIHEDGVSLDEARAYAARWALASEQRAERIVGFVNDPTWRAYVTTYTEGLRLCRAWVRGDAGRFRRLLTEQLTTADLAAVAA